MGFESMHDPGRQLIGGFEPRQRLVQRKQLPGPIFRR
jgi:hypothetical protein